MFRSPRSSGLTVRDLTTTPDFPGREIEKPLGIVTSVVEEVEHGHSASHRKESMSTAISSCYAQLLQGADELDADAVVAVHFDYRQGQFDPLEYSPGTPALMMAYGTAVRLK